MVNCNPLESLKDLRWNALMMRCFSRSQPAAGMVLGTRGLAVDARAKKPRWHEWIGHENLVIRSRRLPRACMRMKRVLLCVSLLAFVR